MASQFIPENGWIAFNHHHELIDLIFNSFIPLVNESSWHYLNLVAGTSSFEDDKGNILTIVYQSHKGEKIQEIHFSKLHFENPVSKEMTQMLNMLTDTYGCEKLTDK
ncbi:MAG: hypothetical protein Roseis2KO_20270 [Roseivirga sp.]